MKKSSRVISTLLLGATLTTFSTGVFAVESQKVVKEKLAGATRYETNLAVSAKWEKAETVILVEGYAIPDALAATPLAKQKDAPILLTETSKLTKATADEITRLGAKNAIIVGGEGVVSKEVEKDLEAMNVKVTRLAGQSRFETSEAVVKEMGEVSKVAVVNGYGESDALSIAAPAAKEGMAIVLSGKDELKGSEDAVKNAKEKFVIGGTGVVSEKLEKEIGAKRLGGETRNETNAAILKNFYNEKEIKNLYVAKDGNPNITELVDALGVGPLAGKEANPVMLAGAKASAGQIEYLKDKTAKVVTEVGGGINQSTLAEIIKALEVKDVNPEEPKDDVEVSEVQALNANQIEIKFSEKVDVDSAENLENYEVKKDNNSKNILDEYDGKPDAEVQEDGKTVILTLPQSYKGYTDGKLNQETLRVKVENVMTENKSNVFDKYENKKVRMFDNALPELKTIKQVGPKDFDLVFSEPVTADSASSIASAIRIDGGSYTCTAKTRFDKDVNAKKIATNAIRITTGADVSEGEHKLSIKENKIYDYAGLKLEAVDTKFEAKKATEDLKATVYKTTNKEDEKDEENIGVVTLDFNREVENAETEGDDANTNVSYYLDYENSGYQAKAAEMKDGKLELTFNRELPSGEHKILVRYKNEKKDKVQDLWENELATREIEFTVAKDTIAPTATVSYNKNDKTVEIKYSKPVIDSEAKKSSNYTLKDSDGKYKSITEDLKTKKGNSLVYTINAEGLSGKYTLTIKGDKIHDTSVEKNAIKEASFELDTLDSKAPQVTSVRFGGKEEDKNKVYIEFGKEMKTEGEGSILDKSLYNLTYLEEDGKSFKEIKNKNLDDIEDAKIETEGNNAVVITLPENIVTVKDKKEISNPLTVKIGRVCDANGNFVAIGGFESNKMFEVSGNEFKAKSDKVVELLNGKDIDEDDILAKDKIANKVEKNKIEVYVKGNITSAVADDIELGNNQCVETKAKAVNLKVEEGVYVQATRLTLKFKNDVKNDETLTFKAGALTTILDTESKEMIEKNLLLGTENQIVKYAKGSAKIFVNENKMAQRVEFELTAPVHNVNIDTFKIGDGAYKINSVGYKTVEVNGKNENRIVVLNLDGKSACNATNGDANIDVELVGTLYDIDNNRTTEMDVFQIDTVEVEKEKPVVTEFAVSGSVVTEPGKEANVTLKQGDKEVETVPTKEGKYTFTKKVVAGDYTLEVSADGYKPVTQKVTVADKDLVIDAITLEKVEEELKENEILGTIEEDLNGCILTVAINAKDVVSEVKVDDKVQVEEEGYDKFSDKVKVYLLNQESKVIITINGVAKTVVIK